ncbi:MAG TPA: NYN domain-containing protein [Candidatus Diapherotrites archaeon]|uniref:NYN domain-containing protein n=1 Tax=Candidatus Iainarchaeum sp. TaxID=3101447 RepID=A0A7J4IW19_9ARCH|nr:NYN domain-containing protein [Candidatus Diapherotrites archaeon]
MQNRAMIFIDGGNLVSGWINYCKSHGLVETGKGVTRRISYEKLLLLLTRGFGEVELIRPYFFGGARSENDAKKIFFDTLRTMGITVFSKLVKHKTKKCPQCGSENQYEVQKGFDVAIATYSWPCI